MIDALRSAFISAITTDLDHRRDESSRDPRAPFPLGQTAAVLRTLLPGRQPPAHTLAALTALLGAGLGSVDVRAAEGLSYETGYGYHTDLNRLAWSRTWSTRWFTDRSWFLSGYWDVSIGHWTPHNPAGGNHSVNDFGITPVLRLRPTQTSGNAIPFLEWGIGGHYLTNPWIYNGRDMTTHYQFGDHVGAGFALGPNHDWDVMLRFQHISNGGLQNPNPGINFFQLRLTHWY